VTYYEQQRPRQYFPDFIVVAREESGEVWWIVETKGEEHPNTSLKSEAARLWCGLMTAAGGNGRWRYLFIRQRAFERAKADHIQSFSALTAALLEAVPILRSGG
jgi:hypothetical protein